MGYPGIGVGGGTNEVQAPSPTVHVIMCLVRQSMVAGRRLAMNSVHHGWFSDNKVWIEFIVAAVVLWLLTMTAVSVFDLRSAG